MFGISEGSAYATMDAAKRRKLADLLHHRNEYSAMVTKVNNQKIQILMHPTAASEQELAEYTRTTVAPMREKLQKETVALMVQAVDVEGLKQMLPMLLAAVANFVDLPLLFEAAGLDPDMIEEALGLLREYFSHNVD